MKKTETLSPSMLRAAKLAASFEYDKSEYIIVDIPVRRDVASGRLISSSEKNAPASI